jgi:hypothetical protein
MVLTLIEDWKSSFPPARVSRPNAFKDFLRSIFITGSNRGATLLPGDPDAGNIRVYVTLEEQHGLVRQIRVLEGRSRQSRRIAGRIGLTGAAVYAAVSRSRY